MDKIEELATSGRRLPFTNQVLIAEDVLLDLVDQLRAALPQDLRDAQRILQDAERVIAQARQEAHQIVQAALEEANDRVSQHRIVQQAEERAERLLADAQRQAEAQLAAAAAEAGTRRQEADQYALEVLRRLEAQLTTMLDSVQKGIEALQSERS